ncbi:MAG: hypothetical protein E7200_06405 [Selenomonas ruminantium]|nr:hypothetical protein [Selenomonas ruminantium]
MKKHDLTRAILAAFMGSMTFWATVDLPQAEAKSTSLYEEYQAQLDQEKLKKEERAKQREKAREQRRIAREQREKAREQREMAREREKAQEIEKARQYEIEAQREIDKQIERENKRAAEAYSPIDEAANSNNDSPSGFLNRIRTIVDSSKTENKYSRFLAKPGNNQQGDDIVSVYEPEPADSTPGPHAQQYQYNPPVAEGTYSFNWQGTPIAQSLYALGGIAHKGVIVNGAMNDKVYARLENVTVNAALDYLSRAFGFNWMMEGNNIIISTNDKMLQSLVMDVSYADKEKLKEEFKALGIAENNIYVNSESGTISITGTPYQLVEAKKRMRQIDRPVAQCLLAAQLIEISHGKSLDLGLTYTMPTYSHTGSETGGSASLKGPWLPKLSFGATLQAERALSKGKVISRPIVLSRNGEPAKVVFGDQVPVMSTTSTATSTNVTVSYKDVGTTLEVTPVINTNTGEISLKIHAEVSNIVQYITQGSTRAPQIATRYVDTTAHVQSGQSLVIGGLMSVTDLDNLSGIPGLMNLPILGELFKFHHRSKTYAEVYIMLTPFIMDDGVDAKSVIRKVEY